MKNIIKKLSIYLSTATSITAMLFSAGVIYAQGAPSPSTTPASNKDAVCQGIGLTGSGCDQNGGPTVDSTVKLAISFLSFIVGIAAVIMIMIGGFKYITSSGDPSNITSAKNTILYAVIGLVVAVLAQVIVRFVLHTAAPSSGTP